MNPIIVSQNLNLNLQTFYFNVNINAPMGPYLGQPMLTTQTAEPSLSEPAEPNYCPMKDEPKNEKNGSYGVTKGVGLANSAMFDPIRYKTEMCKNFMELGQCRFGQNCYYAHFSHELKRPTYKHKNYKTQLCKPFHSEGFCDFGQRCAFIHSKPDLDAIVSKLETFLSSAPPMPRFDKNFNREMADKNVVKEDKRLKVFEKLSQ